MMATMMLLTWLSVSIGVNGVPFDDVPMTQVVATGAQAVFRCRHPRADTIRWKVNGSLVGRNPPPDITLDIIRDDNDNLVDTLTITARPQYNGTEVVCVARFFDGRPEELSQPAILTVLVNASAVDDVFLISPASLNVTVGTVAIFRCQHPTAHGINWKINGSILRDFPEGFSADRSDGSVFSLNIEALAEYNPTVIQCVALFAGSPSEESEQSLMMIQGTLQPVTNLSRSDSTISWSPPFSLDLTNIEPDIVYCVEVYNITCGERNLIISDCDVTEPSYTFNDLADGYIFEYIVTPRSNVSEARNGIPNQPFRDLFVEFSVNSSPLTADSSSMMYMYKAELNSMTFKRPMPSTCMLVLESLDGLGDYEKIIACNRDSIPINLEVHSRRLWKCAVLAYGCWSDSLLYPEPELSTHDVQNISVSSPSVGSIAVTGDFIQGSTAIGVLIITVNSNSTNDTQYHLCHRNGNNVQVEDTISGLAGGHHRVSAFVLEQSGHPFSRTATTPKSVFVMNDSEPAPTLPIVYELRSNSTHVCVTCIFKSSTPTSCLVVVHQQISQLSSSGLMNIESSHKFSRTNKTAYGCISTNLKEYQVGVVDGKLFVDVAVPQDEESSSSVCVGCIAGSVLAVVVFVVFILVVVFIALKIYWNMIKDRRQDVVEASVYIIDTSSRNQYESIPLSIPTKVELSIGENMPLVSQRRVESDGDTEGNNEQSNFQTPLTLSPKIPQAAAELTKEAVEATKIIYSEPDHRPNPGFPAPPPQGDEPQYSSVINFKNSQGVVYACHVVKPPTTTTQQLISDDSTKPLFEYSELIHPPNCQPKPSTTLTATHSNNAENPTSPIVPSPPTPCTVGNLLPLLRPIASKWWSLGEALSIDEDDLDITDANNETDESCLQDMLEFHEEKSDFHHTWEVMATALKQINEEELSEKIQGLYIQPYTNSLPGQTEVGCTERCPTSDVTTEDNEPVFERSDSNSTSGYSSGNSPSADSNDLSNSSDNEDEGYADTGVDGQWTPTQKESVQPVAQDVPKKDNIVHVHNSGPKIQPSNPKQPVTFQHLDDDNPEQRKVHGQCEDDVKPPTPATYDIKDYLMVVDEIQNPVSAPKEKKHHHITVDENQDPSERNSFPRKDVPVQHTSQSVLKNFTYEQDKYFKVSQANEDHAGNDQESSYLHSTSSTIPLTKYTIKLRNLADQVNVGDCLWQIRAQALSQEGTEIHRSDDTRQEACPSPETVLNKRLRVDQRNKRRTNFHRLQEISR